MIQIDLPPLVKRLNLFSRQALEMAASECMSQQAAEITVSHVLIQMLAMPRSDLRVITRQGDIGMEELRQALTVENYTTARSADSYPAFSPMLVEWLKEGWLLASAEMQHSELRGGVLLLALLHSPLRYIPPAAARLLTGINRDRLQQDFVQWTQESAESVVPDADGKGAGTMTDASDTLLARYAKNMTADARNGRLDPVLCRDHEIDLMIDILCRRRKNNPVVVGEAGVGKSALIEGLALRIVAGQVPDKLKNTDIMTLDLGALQAGASVKGEFEKRFKGLMAEVISSPVPVILFIDEAHTLIGAGNQQGGLDISNLLKPALARGELKTIAATTWSEYKKYFEKDAALSRRFQLVKVSEPNAAEATIILRGLSAVYEQSHGVLIDDDALQAAATLSERYLSGRQLTRSAVGCSASLVCQTHCTEEAGMNSNVLTQTIVTGSDPRGLPEFSAIREEINKASHPSQPELNWKLVESLALAIFKANGVDLHTATYYTLARTRTQGLAGFCEGAELLAAMVSHDWDKFWPQGGPARTEMLDWFNSRTGNILRQQISFAESDLPLIYRTERALQLICDKLQQVELKRVPRVENLLYFMQNTRKRLEPQLKSNTENAAQTTVRTLIYAPETQASSTPEAVVPPLPGLPEMKVEVRSLTENPPQASVIKQGSTVRGFIAGIACSVAVASALWWWQVYPVQQQLLQVNDTAQGAATVWMASPELENYERRLQQLLDTSPVQPLETGMQMMRVADSRWPESLQQQQASTQWNEALKTRAQSSPQLRGWLQTRQDLHAFADLVMQREKEGLTLSYIKNVIWQAERGLGQETPVESLLTQYHDARAQKQNTDALEKQINERLEGVLSRWLLLKNNVMPEAATGTTAEK
ncbi:ImpA domain protein [Escherichia coli]|nr:ImpA domain protein [Escherichia coli]